MFIKLANNISSHWSSHWNFRCINESLSVSSVNFSLIFFSQWQLCQAVHHFGPFRNILTTTSWISSNFYTDMVSRWCVLMTLVIPWLYSIASPWRWLLWFWVKRLNSYWELSFGSDIHVPPGWIVITELNPLVYEQILAKLKTFPLASVVLCV